MAYKIGTSVGTLVTLASLKIPDPKGTFWINATKKRAVSGRDKGLGAPRILWHWDFFRVEWRTALRVYCTSHSAANVYIETRTNEADVFDNYIAIMHWPEEDNNDSLRRMDFDIWFDCAVHVAV